MEWKLNSPIPHDFVDALTVLLLNECTIGSTSSLSTWAKKYADAAVLDYEMSQNSSLTLAYTSLLTALQLKEMLFHPKDMIAWITKLESIYQKGQGLMKDSFWSWKTLFIIRMHRSRPSAFDNETETILSLAIRISEVYINCYCVICDLLRGPAHIMFGFGVRATLFDVQIEITQHRGETSNKTLLSSRINTMLKSPSIYQLRRVPTSMRFKWAYIVILSFWSSPSTFSWLGGKPPPDYLVLSSHDNKGSERRGSESKVSTR